MGIKMHSSRNCGFESINRENLQGWFLSHGSTFHYLDGDEWDGCWSTIDWTRLPGTTLTPEVKGRNTSPFAGVIRADHRIALAAMELRTGEFSARKSWLVDGDRVVCAGSGISGPGRVETIVANVKVRPGAELRVNGESLPDGPLRRRVRARSLWVGRMGYVFPGDCELDLIRERRVSDWGAIRSEAMHGAGEKVEHEYVTAIIGHDAGRDSYAYVICPDVDAEAFAGIASGIAEEYSIESGRSHRVVRTDGGVEAMVLWEGDVTGPLKADRRCMALRTGDRLRVVEPARDAVPLSIEWDGRGFELTPHDGRAESIALK
jgi:hyaluronate lyase